MIRYATAALVLTSALAATSQAQAQPPHAYPTAYVPHATPTAAAPYAGRVNHAHMQPQFRWGWFGAERFYPSTARWHRTYMGDHMRWSTHRRY